MQIAKELMQSRVIAIGPDDPLESVHRLFLDEEISGAPVVDEEGRVLGVVSIRDLLREQAENDDSADQENLDFYRDGVVMGEVEWLDGGQALRTRMAGHTAADVMTRSVVSVEPSTPIFEVARKLLENRIHRVLVIEKGPESELLVGNISLFDLARLLADGSQS
jgi:CBS domain-containing protein